MSYKYREKQWLKRNYFDKEKSTYEMAEECNVDPKTILNWMNRYKLEIRDISRRNHLSKANSVDLTTESISFIEGELLGDGCLVTTSPYSANYAHSSQYKEYLIWLDKIFNDFGIEHTGQGINPKETDWGNLWSYQSRMYPELKSIRKKWYKDKKIVPPNLELNPLMARQWYIGDGSLMQTSNSPGSHKRITLCTESFSKNGNQALKEQLNQHGINCNIHNNKIGYRLQIPTNSVSNFLDWIGPCPEQIKNVYGYKWSL